MSARHSPIRFKARVCVLKTSLKWENTHKAGLNNSFGFSFHDEPPRLCTLIQHGRTASTKHTKYTLINCVQAEMTWQNSQLFPEAGHPQIPPAKSQVHKYRASRAAGFVPSGTWVPEVVAVAAIGPARAGPALRLTLSGPAAPAAARERPGRAGPTTQRALGRPPPPPLPGSGESSGAARPSRQRGRQFPGWRAARPGRAAPACLPPAPTHLPPPGARRAPAAPARPHPRPGAAAPARAGWEASARRGRGGGGGRHHVCPPLPEAGCPADKARRRRGRSGRPGRPRRPPRNKRGQEPRKPGALMQ